MQDAHAGSCGVIWSTLCPYAVMKLCKSHFRGWHAHLDTAGWIYVRESSIVLRAHLFAMGEVF